MSGKTELLAIAGPLEGQRFRLPRDQPLLLGRTSRGLNLPDPQVSRRHAEIVWEAERFWLQDLDSMTGTMIDGQLIGPDPVALDIGMRISIGESVFEMSQRRPARRILMWLLFALAILAMYPCARLGVAIIYNAGKPQPRVIWEQPVNQGDRADRIVYVDTCFLRETGAVVDEIVIRRVTDFNENGIDEMWLVWDGAERVYTFNEDGSWLKIGELPEGCIDQTSLVFPELSCPGGSEYVFDYGAPEVTGDEAQECSTWYAGGHYRLEGQTGPVVWMPQEPVQTETGTIVVDPPRPYRMTLVKPDTLAGFLADRGVFADRIHFLICEDMIEGVNAQVLTERGHIQELYPGCVRNIHLDGTVRYLFGDSVPVGVAFTATGREKLIEQLAIFRSGASDPLFMTRADIALMDVVGGEPTPMSAMLLSFHTDRPRLFEAVAEENPSILVRGRLQPRSGFGQLPAMADVWKATSEIAPTYPIQAFGCSQLKLEMGDWRCGNACSSGNTFLTITEVGCDKHHGEVILTADYSGAIASGGHSTIEVRAEVKVSGSDKPIDVSSVKIGYRSRGAGLGTGPEGIPVHPGLKGP